LEMEKYQAIVGYEDMGMLEHIVPLALQGEAYNWLRYEPRFRT